MLVFGGIILLGPFYPSWWLNQPVWKILGQIGSFPLGVKKINMLDTTTRTQNPIWLEHPTQRRNDPNRTSSANSLAFWYADELAAPAASVRQKKSRVTMPFVCKCQNLTSITIHIEFTVYIYIRSAGFYFYNKIYGKMEGGTPYLRPFLFHIQDTCPVLTFLQLPIVGAVLSRMEFWEFGNPCFWEETSRKMSVLQPETCHKWFQKSERKHIFISVSFGFYWEYVF